MKGFAIGRVLKVRDFGTRKWPNRLFRLLSSMQSFDNFMEHDECQ